jgi:endonuclease/exonuclease/phosphatase family metal-dependent hydrolase
VDRLHEAYSGEHCAVYVRSDRFKIEETETLWLSDTPREPGRLGWGAHLPRICTRVRVQERSTGIRVELFNTHFHWGEEITRRSTDMIVDLLSRVTPDRPAVLMGDFNLDPQSAEHARLTSALLSGGRVLVDSYHEAHPAQDVGTSHGFSGRPQRRIDWILVSNEMAIHSAEIEMHSEAGRYPSDHFPVTATVELPEARYQSSV